MLASDDPRSGGPRGSASIVPRHAVIFLCGAFLGSGVVASWIAVGPPGRPGRKAMTVAKLRSARGAEMPAGRLVRGGAPLHERYPEAVRMAKRLHRANPAIRGCVGTVPGQVRHRSYF